MNVNPAFGRTRIPKGIYELVLVNKYNIRVDPFISKRVNTGFNGIGGPVTAPGKRFECRYVYLETANVDRPDLPREYVVAGPKFRQKLNSAFSRLAREIRKSNPLAKRITEQDQSEAAIRDFMDKFKIGRGLLAHLFDSPKALLRDFTTTRLFDQYKQQKGCFGEIRIQIGKTGRIKIHDIRLPGVPPGANT